MRRLRGLEAALGAGGELYQKCDDLTSEVYGGNKVRTLEVLFGEALERGSTHVYATGAFGSNHATATSLHAPRVGLVPGAILYPQPHSESARRNLEVTIDRASCHLRALPHWSALPFGMWSQARNSKKTLQRATIMMPGGATPLGALGYVSAGLELAEQVHAGELPRPATIVVAAGSNTTTAGLLVGIALAVRRGLGFRPNGLAKPPRLVAVRVTPWPVTSKARVLGLAHAASLLLAKLGGDATLACTRAELGALLRLDGTQLGPGYGFGTDAGREANRLFEAHAHGSLELTYSGKSAAAAIQCLRRRTAGPLLYWATKSSAPLPQLTGEGPAAPARMRRWLERAHHAEPNA